ncbi:MAG: aldose 1-epimerase [Caulobacteraceae bacterium]
MPFNSQSKSDRSAQAGPLLTKPAGPRTCVERVGRFLAVLLVLALAAPGLALAASRYTARTIGDVVQLRDNSADVAVSVFTPVSNAYEMVVKGHNVLRMTIRSVDEMRAAPGLNGIPLLAPFANRLDQTAFYANGRKYNFDTEIGTVRGPVPIHGFLSGATSWKVVEAKADAKGAWVTETLEFYKNPLYMQNFPFAHVLTMTYRLSNGELEVRLRLDNLAIEPMPVSVGYHPFFSLSDSDRSDWTLSVPAQTHWKLNGVLVPTGETEAADVFWGGDRHDVPLSRFATRTIDDLFSDLERDSAGRAVVRLQGKKQGLSVTLGPKFKALVLFSPPAPPPPRAAGAAPQTPRAPPAPVVKGPPVPLSATDQALPPPQRGSIAIEPMAGISNSMNAAQAGTYKELQSIPPGGSWQESFWLKPTGY